MTVFLAFLHYIALGLGLSGLIVRHLQLSEARRGQSLRPLYFGDNLWGLAALLWIVTGLLRAFAGFEKGSQYYLHNHWFYLKMTLFLLTFLLELYPMITFIKWRLKKKDRIDETDLSLMRTIQKINLAQITIIVFVVFSASRMARGF